MIRRPLGILGVMLLVAACGSPAPTASPSTPSSAAAALPASTAEPSSIPAASSSPAPSATPSPAPTEPPTPSPTPALKPLASILDGSVPKVTMAAAKRRLNLLWAKYPAVATSHFNDDPQAFVDTLKASIPDPGCSSLYDNYHYAESAQSCLATFDDLYFAYRKTGDEAFLQAARGFLGAVRQGVPAVLYKRFTVDLRAFSDHIQP